MRTAIALLMTLFFLILFSAALGISLQQLNKARTYTQKEAFLIQSESIIDDVLSLLQSSAEIKAIVDDNTSASLYAFLSASSFIPVQSGGYRMLISLSSARGKINVNSLCDANGNVNNDRVKALRDFFLARGLQEELVWFLVDAMRRDHAKGVFYTDLFDNEKELFGDYIVSRNHLETILRYYKRKYHENVFEKVAWEDLFSYRKDPNTVIDLNYAPSIVWEALLGCSPERAQELAANAGLYESIEDLGLNAVEKTNLGRFRVGFVEPVIAVEIDVEKDGLNAKIFFEYDMRTKKATDFVYEF